MAEATGPSGLPLCAVCGEREVPRVEWPADRKLPKVCDPCLRANSMTLALTPGGETETTGPEPGPAVSSDFAGTSDFG